MSVKKFIFGLIVATIALNALSLSELKSMPKSIERDFYIWRFLQQDSTSKEDALKTKELIYHLNGKLISSFYKKTNIKLHKKIYKYGKHLNLDRYRAIIKNLQREPNFYKAWLNLDTKDKLEVFNLSGKSGRKALNKNMPSNIYKNMSKYWGINEFIFRVYREHLNSVENTIINTKPPIGNKINYKHLMGIGFSALVSENRDVASAYFRAARYKARDRFHADRAIFWNYMASKDSKLLYKLASSYDFNIYKLIAFDFLKQPYPSPAKLPNITKDRVDFDITNPINWAKLKRKIFSKNTNLLALASIFKAKNTLGYYSYIINKASRDTKQYFPIIYTQYMKGLSIKRKALILALMRQESRFIPASISSSFALGLMQFMPFLIKDIAKKRGDNIRLEDMFKPKVAIIYANYHLNYLEKYLPNPLFVAYAYNAGIGYTRRMLRKTTHFKRFGELEPYLSLEMVDNDQANEYGKKVLANYVIYRKLLGSPVKITTILKSLITYK